MDASVRRCEKTLIVHNIDGVEANPRRVVAK